MKTEATFQTNPPTTNYGNESQWFQDIIDFAEVHKLMFETDTATNDMKSFYKIFMSDDELGKAKVIRKYNSETVIKHAAITFLTNLKPNLPKKLAISFSDNELLVWAEISDYYHESHNQLIMAEAKTNALFHEIGFHVNTSIVEECDKISTPPHYKEVKL